MKQDPWQLDPQLAADSLSLLSWPLCDVLLMDDAHYPWLILVPRIPYASELIDLPERDRMQLSTETDAAAHALRAVFSPDKLNIAALGNVVRQLHVHVIARFKADAAWPAPVWGAVPVEKRPGTQSEALRAQVLEALHQAMTLKENT